VLALITFGEGWHNNHHRFPGAARQGLKWWEFDMTYYGLSLLSWLHLVHDLRPYPASLRTARGDADGGAA
jgi:stearoyl-CoA desaturase (delta-9 desaturase)